MGGWPVQWLLPAAGGPVGWGTQRPPAALLRGGDQVGRRWAGEGPGLSPRGQVGAAPGAGTAGGRTVDVADVVQVEAKNEPQTMGAVAPTVAAGLL